MIDLDSLKQQAKDAADMIADKSVELYKAAEVKTKELAKKGKLTAEVAALKRDLKKLYTELGESFYNAQKTSPDGKYDQLFTEIGYVLEQLDLKQIEYDSIGAKAEDTDPVFEEAEKAVNDAADTVKEAAEDVADAVKDVAEDASDAVENTIEEIKDKID